MTFDYERHMEEKGRAKNTLVRCQQEFDEIEAEIQAKQELLEKVEMRLHALAACEEEVYAEDWKGHMAATTLAGKPCGALPVLFYESGSVLVDGGASIEESYKEMDVIELNKEAKNIYAALPEMKLKRDAAAKALAEARKTYEFQVTRSRELGTAATAALRAWRGVLADEGLEVRSGLEIFNQMRPATPTTTSDSEMVWIPPRRPVTRPPWMTAYDEFDELLDNLSTRSAMTSTSTASIAHTPQRVESLIDVDPTVHPMLDDSLLGLSTAQTFSPIRRPSTTNRTSLSNLDKEVKN